MGMPISRNLQRMLPAVLVAAWLVGAPAAGYAQTGSSSSSSSAAAAAAAAPREVESYWTSERIRDAKPLELQPKAGADGMPEGFAIASPAAVPTGPSERGEGRPPQVSLDKNAEKRLLPPMLEEEGLLHEDEHIIPQATSSFGAHFTTTRVFPDDAVTTYPYRAAGKLFFTDKGQNFVCTASVLRPRIIVTAGHCVTHPSTNPAQRYFFTNFLFVPAYNNGAAPYKSWTSSQQWVANAWYFSNGSVPNEQDVAMLIANDQVISGQVRKIGEVTGWLGYVTNGLSNNNVTMLGYPCNLDSCTRMEVNGAQTFGAGGSNTYTYGSAMRGGSSGGPWIQDFGVNPTSNPAVSLGLNYLVAVTSYGPVATEPKYQGASNLDARFLDVLNHACGSNPGNC